MAKIAIVNDTHFGVRGDNEIFRSNIERFFSAQFFPYLDKHGIKHVVNAGDVMDRRKYVNYKTVQSFRSHFIDPIIERGIILDNILGNHDVAMKSTNDINCIEELIGYLMIDNPNIRVYKSTQEVDLYGLKTLYIPWINRQNYDDSISKIKNTDAKFAIGHLEITGFEMEAGHICEDGLNKTLFNHMDMVLSGHFHKKSDNGRIFYLGTQYQLHWSDYGETKGFHVFDTDTMELEFIPNKEHMFAKVVYDDSDGVEDYINYDFDNLHNKSIKIIVDKREDIYVFENFINKILEQDLFDYSLIENVDYDMEIDEDDLVVEDTMTLLNKAVDATKDSSNADSKNKLKKLLKNLFTEALST